MSAASGVGDEHCRWQIKRGGDSVSKGAWLAIAKTGDYYEQRRMKRIEGSVTRVSRTTREYAKWQRRQTTIVNRGSRSDR